MDNYIIPHFMDYVVQGSHDTSYVAFHCDTWQIVTVLVWL